MISVVIVGALVVLATLVFTGDLNNKGGGRSSFEPAIDYREAAPLAFGATAGVVGGPWTIVAAEGIGVPDEVPLTNLSAFESGQCTFTLVSGGATEVSIPATPGNAPPGKFSVWVFLAKNTSSSSILIIGVNNGHARPLALFSGCTTASDFAKLGEISVTRVVNSTAIAPEFDLNGGDSFLDNETVVNQFLLLLGGFPGTGNAPIWEAMDSTCSVPPTSSAGSWLTAYYFATNATLVTAPTSGSGACT